jgi:eukaryotic-like serine/threonine-protein kinase
MGEVYRARDTRLGREVAIKVLPPEVSADADRLRRFEKEAQAASSLNHPNIVTIHEVERLDSTSFIVMELVDGKTLRDLLAEGALPVRRLLGIAAQIADGLARAHSAGIVHRDLKPENVMVTKEGLVKILDFGLAKLEHPELEGGEITQTPTVSEGTRPGVVMGTVGYMSPEQASGHPVDFRSDQFSFGSILYELATGKQSFRRGTVAQTLAAIIQDEPEPIAAVNPRTPTPLRWIIERCLAKDPRERYASTEDLARELAIVRDRIGEVSGSQAITAIPTRRNRTFWLLVAAVALLITTALSTAAYFRAHRAPVATFRASILPPDGTIFSMTGEDFGVPAPVAVSPDGKRLVYGAIGVDQTRLYVRQLDSFAARSLAGTEGATYPFWSPDGGRIGFFTGYPHGQLKVISAAGGPLETLVDAPNARGGSWGRQGTIVFSPENADAIFQISEKGGKATPVTFPTVPKSITHRFPSFLPDGRHFLYLAKRMSASEKVRDNDLGIFVGSTASRETRRLLPDISGAIYANPGYVLFVREGTLMGLPFDAAALQATGAAIPIVPNVEFSSLRSNGVFSASPAGVLAFRGGGAGESLSRLAWLDRSGKPAGAAEMPPSKIEELRLSPDGKRASLVLGEPRTGNSDVWALELPRGTRTRLTRGSAGLVDTIGGVFSPDGSRVVLASRGKTGSEDLSVLDSSGEGAMQTLVSSPEGKTATDWSRDGRFILFQRPGARNRAQIWVYSVMERSSSPFLQTESSTRDGIFSPDGRWIAYASDESGEPEIFVRPFPGPGVKQQVSRGGAGPIRWRSDGRELIYAGSGGKVMAVDVKAKDTFESGEPRVLLALPPGTGLWDITADHQHVLIAARSAGESPSPPISIVTNWAAEIRK